MVPKLTTEEFIIRAISVHNNEYDYSKVVYKHSKKPVIIICNDHGEFLQRPIHHLRGSGCQKCSYINLSTKLKSRSIINTERFIKKANKIHNNKYNYDLIEYHNCKTKIKILCPEHGYFEQEPRIHLNSSGCQKCRYLRPRKKFNKDPNKILANKVNFIKNANIIHNNKYNYDIIEYYNSRTKIKILCPKHGYFEQEPRIHLKGSGCQQCGFIKMGISKKKSIPKFYMYSVNILN